MRIPFLIFTSLLVTLSSLLADVIYVKAGFGSSGDGSSWSSAYGNLQDALSNSASGDEIWVAAGTYYPDEGLGQNDDDRSATFTLKSGVEIYGGFSATGTPSFSERDISLYGTILSGDIDQNDDSAGNSANAYHVVTGAEASFLDGFIITAGNADEDENDGDDYHSGGGLYNQNSSPTLTNCSFEGNSASTRGGAIYNDEFGSLTLINCSFQGNFSGFTGGAIDNDYLTTVTLTNCSFEGNTASHAGGGIHSYYSILTLTNCSFEGNSANRDGGAIYNDNTSPEIINNSFLGNSAVEDGGAIANDNALSVIINCSFQGNSANRGGAIYNNDYSSPILTNCVIWNNAANGDTTSSSASIYNLLIPGTTSNPSYAYCLIANSGGSTSWDSALGIDNGNNIDADPLFVFEVDPLLAPTTGGDLRLSTGSPAQNVGDSNANSISTDLAGSSRIQDLIIDLGAYEGAIAITFYTLYPDLAADGDENGNGVSNFLEYALGIDPRGSHSFPLSPTITSDGELIITYRNNGSDINPVLESSTTLQPNSWQSVTTGIPSINGSQTTITLDLSVLLDLKMFFRQRFTDDD
ncbi:MAG: choice-of-anchor Q domain-containing protein [Maribacter stanieri]